MVKISFRFFCINLILCFTEKRLESLMALSNALFWLGLDSRWLDALIENGSDDLKQLYRQLSMLAVQANSLIDAQRLKP